MLRAPSPLHQADVMRLRQQLSRTHRFIAGLVAAFALLQANHAFGQDENISLKRMGSFHTGERLVELSGKQIKQMTRRGFGHGRPERNLPS